MQAIAAGLGGPAVAAVLAALSLNYKHFEGGLPDLLLMRAVRTDGGAIEDAVSAKGVESARGVAAASVASSLATEAKAAAEVETEVSTVRFSWRTIVYVFRRKEGGEGRGGEGIADLSSFGWLGSPASRAGSGLCGLDALAHLISRSFYGCCCCCC